jgi:hypothetical protein
MGRGLPAFKPPCRSRWSGPVHCAAMPVHLPEVLAVEAGAGLPAYLDWVASATRE